MAIEKLLHDVVNRTGRGGYHFKMKDFKISDTFEGRHYICFATGYSIHVDFKENAFLDGEEVCITNNPHSDRSVKLSTDVYDIVGNNGTVSDGDHLLLANAQYIKLKLVDGALEIVEWKHCDEVLYDPCLYDLNVTGGDSGSDITVRHGFELSLTGGSLDDSVITVTNSDVETDPETPPEIDQGVPAAGAMSTGYIEPMAVLGEWLTIAGASTTDTAGVIDVDFTQNTTGSVMFTDLHTALADAEYDADQFIEVEIISAGWALDHSLQHVASNYLFGFTEIMPSDPTDKTNASPTGAEHAAVDSWMFGLNGANRGAVSLTNDVDYGGTTPTTHDPSTGDIIGFAFNLDRGILRLYINGVKTDAWWRFKTNHPIYMMYFGSWSNDNRFDINFKVRTNTSVNGYTYDTQPF